MKISELDLVGRPWIYEGNRPIVRKTIEIFEVDRCLSASNFDVVASSRASA